jgi:uncharacterized protein (DUF342 family)
MILMSDLEQYFEIEVSPNKTEATIIQYEKVKPGLGFTPEIILQFLQEQGITYGINGLVVAKLSPESASLNSRL